MSLGENFADETSCYDLYNKARNEKRYLQHLLTQGLQKINSSMPFHNIMDTSRNGQQGIREDWSDWCNVNGAAIGRKPSADTGDVNLDAFVWATGPGVSDGASGAGGDCGGEVAFKPMPEKGEFSLEYFQMMLGECRGCVKRRAVPEIAARCG
jgi:cellulose 1,4-beta-cellobiosidase